MKYGNKYIFELNWIENIEYSALFNVVQPLDFTGKSAAT